MEWYVIVSIVLTVVGVIILITTITFLAFVMKLLGRRAFNRRRWIFVQIMLFFFVVGYTINALESLGITIFGLPGELMVALVYFFGGIFTLVTILAIRNMLRDILGKHVPDDEAIGIFLKITETDTILTHLSDMFVIQCEICNRTLTYTVADVVRDHAFTLERGIQVEEVFGTISYKLHPVHKCKDGRREITVIHDNTLAVRSVEENRLIFGGRI